MSSYNAQVFLHRNPLVSRAHVSGRGAVYISGYPALAPVAAIRPSESGDRLRQDPCDCLGIPLNDLEHLASWGAPARLVAMRLGDFRADFAICCQNFRELRPDLRLK